MRRGGADTINGGAGDFALTPSAPLAIFGQTCVRLDNGLITERYPTMQMIQVYNASIKAPVCSRHRGVAPRAPVCRVRTAVRVR